MTDAALPVAQSAVNQFTEHYLSSIGCTVDKEGDRWEVTVPDEAETQLQTGRIVLRIGEAVSESVEGEEPLHPESSFFQKIITEASGRAPVGTIRVESENAKIEMPPWLPDHGVNVMDTKFTPYYDRTAAVILYRISIETVSEYQTDLLRAIAVDVRTMDPLPTLEETFLGMTSPGDETTDTKPFGIEKEQANQIVTHARERVVERVQPRIDEIHQEASRAADAELEEYRQMQQQRIEELDGRLSNLSTRIDGLSESIQDGSGQKERVQSLKKRKELKSEYEAVESDLEEIRRQREQGFPEKQREIRGRHALEVVVTPLTITQVEYERGEIEFELADETTTRSLTVGYGCGIGVTDDIHCDVCERLLTQQNPLLTVKKGFQCARCQ